MCIFQANKNAYKVYNIFFYNNQLFITEQVIKINNLITNDNKTKTTKINLYSELYQRRKKIT